MPDDAPAPQTRRVRKKERTRRHIQVAALRLFLEHGFDSVTLSEIAEAADVDTTTLWRHFKTKEAILVADFASWLGQFRSTLDSLPSEHPPLTAAIVALVSASAAVDVELDSLRAQVLTKDPAEGVRTAVLGAEELAQQELAAVLAERLEVDPARDARPYVLSSAVIATGRWVRENRLEANLHSLDARRYRDIYEILIETAKLIRTVSPEDVKPLPLH